MCLLFSEVKLKLGIQEFKDGLTLPRQNVQGGDEIS